MPNAIQIAQGRQTPLTAGILMAVLTEAPLFSAFDVRTSSGTNFLSLAQTSVPDLAFARLNQGFTASDANFELREFACSLIGGLVKSELITAGLWNKAHASAGAEWFDIQLSAKLTADILQVERQMILGTTNDADGFPGAKEMTPFSAANIMTMTETAAHTSFQRSVINVAGTTADTASSVYSFVFGELDSQLVLGNDSGGELIQVGERRVQNIANDTAVPTKTADHELAQVHGFVGLSVSGFNQQIAGETIPTQYSVRRAANITADATKTCTDAVIDKLVRSHKTGKRPNLLAMSHRSGEQLAASRQATAVNFNMGQSGDAQNAVATVYPAPPEMWTNIPIAYPNADVIADTDAIEAV